MPNQVQLHGLGAFSVALAILSTDNIAPMALIQIEKLGSSFTCGEILSQLCSRLLPMEFSVASVSQLAGITDLLAQKLSVLGFGNFLPSQVVRIHDAYRSLGIDPPIDLLDSLTVDATVDLLYSISQALCDEAKIIRISGSFAMGHILGSLLFMFPHDTVVNRWCNNSRAMSLASLPRTGCPILTLLQYNAILLKTLPFLIIFETMSRPHTPIQEEKLKVPDTEERAHYFWHVDHRADGESLADVAAQHGIHPNTGRIWRKERSHFGNERRTRKRRAEENNYKLGRPWRVNKNDLEALLDDDTNPVRDKPYKV
ncbi:hypothetical protein GQ44DRAFT_758452 [Phaeosphaeriaceae sp. PMI808]|nr:hypothetical protein GQ44DRAFT_758452 [Phaeosphaeriaceae sp. PMI808]